MEAQNDGTYKIFAYSGQNSLQMLDDNNGSAADGNNVTTWEDNNTPAQRWYFQDTGGGWYRIIPASAGQNGQATLDVRNGNAAKAGDTLNIYHYYGGDNQVFRLDWAGASQVLPSAKKGIGGRDTKTSYMHCAWYYNWGSGEPGDTPTGVEFVPMAWGYYGGDMTQFARDTLAQPNVHSILAFNEPDHTDQSNLSVDYALQGYAGLANAGGPVGSPACADAMGQWMNDFMAGAASRGYRVDYVCVHCYIRDPYQFENYITQVHNKFWQQPLWITEFAPADWSGNNPVSNAEAANFMRIVVPWLNSQWFVQRYAWYTGSNPGTWTLGSAALVDYDGRLTDLGRLYARM